MLASSIETVAVVEINSATTWKGLKASAHTAIITRAVNGFLVIMQFPPAIPLRNSLPIALCEVIVQ